MPIPAMTKPIIFTHSQKTGWNYGHIWSRNGFCIR